FEEGRVANEAEEGPALGAVMERGHLLGQRPRDLGAKLDLKGAGENRRANEVVGQKRKGRVIDRNLRAPRRHATGRVDRERFHQLEHALRASARRWSTRRPIAPTVQYRGKVAVSI